MIFYTISLLLKMSPNTHNPLLERDGECHFQWIHQDFHSRLFCFFYNKVLSVTLSEAVKVHGLGSHNAKASNQLVFYYSVETEQLKRNQDSFASTGPFGLSVQQGPISVHNLEKVGWGS